MQPRDSPGVRRGHRAQQADARLEHEPGRGHPGQKGELRVVALDCQGPAQGERPRPDAGWADRAHFLLGDGQVEATAPALGALARGADLGQQGERLVARAAVERPLGGRVVELGAAADPRAPQVDGHLLAVGVEVDRPDARGPLLLREQARRPLRQRHRVQRHARVRGVERRAARPRLGVHSATGRDEGGDVGDRVAHPPAATCPPLEREGLVEVARPGRVEGHERHVAQIRPRTGAERGIARLGARRRVGRGEDLAAERRRHIQLTADPREALDELGAGRRGGWAQAAGHGPDAIPRSSAAAAGLTAPAAGWSPTVAWAIPVTAADDLLEREAELEALSSAGESARDGRGRLVVIEGPAGSGKSALVAVAAERAEAAGLRVLRARGSELERDLGFGAVRRLFEGAVGAATPAEREELLSGAAAPAAWVVSADGGGDAVRAGADSGFAVPHAIYWLATNLSLADPLVLAVDDLHWVDAASLRSLGYLGRRLGDLPVALVVTMRPDEPSTPVAVLDALRTEPGAARITLRPLRPPSVAAIVRAAMPDAGDDLCSACFEASAGNPFYVRELVRSIAADGAGEDPAAVVRRAAIPSVGDRVSRRIARVGGEAVALARAMAVLDDGGRLADAAAVAGLAEDAAAKAASRMRRIEVLAGEDPFAFVHPLVRRSVYDALSVSERDAAHTAAAYRLRTRGRSREEVAAQLAAVRPARSATVVAALRDAAREAMARAAPEAAIRWLTRAMEEGAPEPSHAVLLHELGRVELVGRDPRAIEHLQAALEHADDPVLRARVGLDLAEILVNAGRWEAGVAAATDALGELGDGMPELAVEIEAFVAVSRAFDPRSVDAFVRDRKRLCGLADGETWAARALAVLLAANAAARGERPAEVRALVERGLRDGKLLAERGAGGWASAHALMALVAIDADDRALEVIDELAVQAQRSGALIGTITSLGYRGWVYARVGDLVASEAELRPLVQMGFEQGMPLLVSSGVWFLLDALVERLALDDLAAALLALELDPAFLDTGGGAMLVETRGRLRLAHGDLAAALADLRACGATYAALGFGLPFSSWRSALAVALAAEARDEALGLVAEEVATATATGLARPQGVALRAAGLVRGGDEGLACLRESEALLRATPARLEHARSLVELGAALRRRPARPASAHAPGERASRARATPSRAGRRGPPHHP